MKSSDHKAPSLESILRLKRLEQPAPEFWTQFESELRAKQLAAIVEKRPWWASFARNFSLLSRYPVPMGAVAALAIAWAGFHGYRTIGHTRAIGDGEWTYLPSTRPAVEPTTASLRQERASEAGRTEEAATTSVVRENPPAGDRAATDSQMALNSMPETAATIVDGLLQSSGSNQAQTPSERSIAANLATAQAAEPEIARNFLTLSQNFDAGLVPERAPIRDPLAQMTSPSEERRARLMADVLPTAATLAEQPVLSNNRFIGRLSDDRLYSSISRYKVGGSELSIRF